VPSKRFRRLRYEATNVPAPLPGGTSTCSTLITCSDCEGGRCLTHGQRCDWMTAVRIRTALRRVGSQGCVIHRIVRPSVHHGAIKQRDSFLGCLHHSHCSCGCACGVHDESRDDPIIRYDALTLELLDRLSWRASRCVPRSVVHPAPLAHVRLARPCGAIEPVRDLCSVQCRS
jgi:hypothetical protein